MSLSLSELINPTARQKEFFQSLAEKKKYILYGGAAGGGKSYILRWSLIALLMDYAKQGIQGVRVGLFCVDYPSLKERHITKIETEFPPWLGTWRRGDREYHLAPRFGGGVIALRNLDNVQKYLSAEFAAVAVDELTENLMDVFDFLRLRLRWPGVEYTPFLSATNPGQRGHGWVKSLWLDHMIPPELEKERDGFSYIRARVDDNPHVSQTYIDQLDSLPPALRKAYKEGDWDAFEGQFFEEWSKDHHVVEPFTIPESWTRFISLDWGFSKPYSVHWHAVDEDGVIWTYRELYGYGGSPDTGSKEDATTVAKRIVALEQRENGAKEPIAYRVADPAIWSDTGHTGPTIAESFIKEGIAFQPADNARVQGAMQVHLRLRGEDFQTENWKPGWKIFKTCQHLIRTLPTLVYSKHNVEDVDTTQEDHAYDECRYALMSRPWISNGEKKKQELDRYGRNRRRREEANNSWMTA